MEKSVHVHPDEVIQFVDAIRTERLQPMHPELLLAPPLGVRPLWVVVNNHRCHVFPPMTIEIEMLSDWLMDFFGYIYNKNNMPNKYTQPVSLILQEYIELLLLLSYTKTYLHC